MEYRYGSAAAADPRSAWPNISGGQGFYTVESLVGNPSASLPLQYSQPLPKSVLEPSYELSRAGAHLGLAPKLTSHDISQHSSQGGGLGSAFPRPSPAESRLHDVSLYSSQGVSGSTLPLQNPYDVSLNAPQGVSGSTLPRPNLPDARLNEASLYASQGVPGSALPRPNPADALLHDASSLYASQGLPGSTLPRPNPLGARLHDVSLYSAQGVPGSTLPRPTPTDPRPHDIPLYSAHGAPGSILPQPNPMDPRLRDIALHSAQGIPGSNLPVANGPDPRRLNLHPEPGYPPEPVRDPIRESLRLPSSLSHELSRELELRELEIRRRQLDRELLVERERAREYREGMIQREIVARERQLLARPVPQQVLQPKYNDTRKTVLNELPLLPVSANKRVLAKKNPVPKASGKRGRAGRPGWCSICKIDCQTKYVLENHHATGKKHKLKLQELAERSGNAKKGNESKQKQSQEVEKKPQTEQQQQLNSTKSEGKEANELSNLGKRKQKVKGEGAASSKKRQRVSDAIVVSTQSCKICNVVCSSQVVLESHLAGKKHAARLAKLQEGSKAASEVNGDGDKNVKDDGKDTKNSEDEREKSGEDVTALEVKDGGKEPTGAHEDDGGEDVNPEDDVKDANAEEENGGEEEEDDGEDAKDGSENNEEA